MVDESMTSPDEQPDAMDATTQEPGAAPPEMRTEDAIRFAIGLFADLAWINLGIRANPATGEAKADFPQARLAIDAINSLVQLTEGRLESHEVRDLHNLVSSLQMNFVQRYTAGT